MDLDVVCYDPLISFKVPKEMVELRFYDMRGKVFCLQCYFDMKSINIDTLDICFGIYIFQIITCNNTYTGIVI